MEVFLSSAIGNLYSRWLFLCNIFLNMSPVTTTTPSPLVTVVCSRTVTVAPTSVDLAALGYHDVVLPP